MTIAKWLLLLNGVAFAGYGIVCLFAPSLPAQYAGFVIPNASAVTETMAMYGGLQTGVGVLLCVTALRPERIPLGLVVLGTLIGSLAVGRAFGVLTHGINAYNGVALVYEAGVSIWAWMLFRGAAERNGAEAVAA